MQILYDFFPIILFFVVYKLYNIYAATAAAMAASFIQLVYHWIRYRKIQKMQLMTVILIMILGSATLILHNPIFIKWKPSAVYWVFGIVFIGSHFIGKKPLLRRMMEKQISLPDHAWKKLNMSWAIYFILMGIVNIYIVYHFSTNTWVNFKLYGILGSTVVFAIIQAIYLSRYVDNN